MKFRQQSAGFALPTVLIASIIMMIVLLSAATASSSIRAALNAQYYNQLAREAAESGMARANDCLAANAYIAQWSDTNPLYPNTSCSGGAACDNASSCFVMQTDNVRTTFTVSAPKQQNVSQLVKSVGKVELLRTSNGQPWRTYTAQVSARVGIDLNLNSVVFGYIGGQGAFFTTIAADGTLSAVGNNYYGQLGNGTTSNSSSPTEFELPAGRKPASVYTNFLSVGRNIFVITGDGLVYGAGANYYGQLGNGNKANRQSTPVQYQLPAGKQARSVGVLGYANFVITKDNNIYAAGMCSDGLLGSNYTISGCTDRSSPVRVDLPTPDAANPNTLPTDNITLDYHCAYVRMQGGRVYGWGVNRYGELANATTTSSSKPVQIGTFGDAGQPNAVQVMTDGASVWILDDSGKVWGAGYNYFGQLGDGSTTNRSSLVQFQLPNPEDRVTKIATDQYSFLALTDKGEVWGVGNNSDGQLGNGGSGQINATPTKFILPSGVKAVDLYNTASGSYNGSPYNNTYVIGDDGKVYGTGANDFGQLGDGTTTDRLTPVAMDVIDGTNIRAEQVLSGFGTTVILTSDQKIYTVGNNSDGQLGDGTTNNSSVPKANRYTNILPVTSF